MVDRDDRFEEVVEAIVDGRPVDWSDDRLVEGLTPAEREVLCGLDALARSDTESLVVDPELRRRRALLERLSKRSWDRSRYLVHEEFARGGMGAIVRVFDRDLRRTLAMKVMSPADPARAVAPTPKSIVRFVEEAQVTAQLDHPGIVPVHELGLDEEGRVYFTMKMVQGRTLRAIIRTLHAGHGEWTQTRVLGVVLRVCEAMAFAHSKGVIHRDLKPANVMVGRFGEVYVMDWGLARVTGRGDPGDDAAPEDGAPVRGDDRVKSDRQDARQDAPDSSLLTREGDVIGTPAYMAPEQAQGRSDLVGPNLDVYAVGAILYELLTGRAPSLQRTPARDASTGESGLRRPWPVHKLNADVSAELEAICDKAMAPRIDERYATMERLAEDLRAYLEHRVVTAYTSGPRAELAKWVKRNRAVATLAAAAVVLVSAVTVTFLLTFRAQRTEARESARVAEENERDAREATREKEEAARRLETALDELRRSEASARDEAARADASQRAAEVEAADALAAKREAEAQRALADASRREADAATRFVLELFQDSAAAGKGDGELTATDILDRGAAAIESMVETRPLERTRMREVVGRANLAYGRYELAATMLETSYDERRAQAAGGAAPETLALLDALLDLDLILDRPDRAEARLEEARADVERRLGGDDPRTLVLAARTGELLVARGRFAEAERVLVRVVDGLEQALPADDARLLRALRPWLALRVATGRAPESRPLLERTTRRMEARRDDDDLEASKTRAVLARAHAVLGRLEEARPLAERALAGLRDRLGDEHPVTIGLMLDLADLRRAGGDLEAARVLYAEALAGARRRLPDGHPLTARLRWEVAGLHLVDRELDAAESLLREQLADEERAGGEARGATTLHLLAQLGRARGHLKDAADLARRALQLAGSGAGETREIELLLAAILAEIDDQVEPERPPR